MRYLITGADGMLAQDLSDVLIGQPVRTFTRAEWDICDPNSAANLIEANDVVFNCAAYNNVDLAETDESTAIAVNAIGVQNLARAARDAGAKLVTFSSDYVFDGSASTPYLESAIRGPVSAYGRSKAMGEELALAEHPLGIYVIRTAWLYGKHGRSFARTMLDLAESKDTWPVVNDQYGQPTWTRDLARHVIALIDQDAPPGIYHGTNSGSASWFEFAQAVLEEAGLDPQRVTPIDSSAFNRPAQRPYYSVLGHGRWQAIDIAPMRPWREALHTAFEAGVFNY